MKEAFEEAVELAEQFNSKVLADDSYSTISNSTKLMSRINKVLADNGGTYKVGIIEVRCNGETWQLRQ